MIFVGSLQKIRDIDNRQLKGLSSYNRFIGVMKNLSSIVDIKRTN